ncbi:MAG: cobyric acid synthase [Anaerolineae bacterium]
MLQGTSSSVGKSLLAAALCRLYARRGLRVAPFKAQNLSNNAAVCADGSEIGRSQALQALAAGVEPTADMNPILLKPEAGSGCQVVVLGRPWRSVTPGADRPYRERFLPVVTAALDRLRTAYDLVVIEGAGGPAELNLRGGDIVNMPVALHARAPVLLIGDIERGGVFAQLLGTLWLLPDEERALVRGLVVNKFRGDPAFFASGRQMLQERAGIPVLGIVPYLEGLALPEEDAAALDGMVAPRARRGTDVAVVRLPHVANFDDFDPLAAEPGVTVRYIGTAAALGAPDAVVLPGTKSTIADLSWLRASGLADAIVALANGGTPVAGICGGYQMLGREVLDPDGVESSQAGAAGLGLLAVSTTFRGDKQTHRVRASVSGGRGWLAAAVGEPVEGYEIHMGRSAPTGGGGWLAIHERGGTAVSVEDGACSGDGRIWGCYVHGLFGNAGLRRAWLHSLGWQGVAATAATSGPEAALDRLADAVRDSLDMARLEEIVWGS